MGVPELLKFVAKTSPGALCKVPRSSDGTTNFDFVLIDATNLAQTIGFQLLIDMLTSPAIRVTKAVVFIFDSQRRRIGTAREQRTFVSTQDVEVTVHKVAETLESKWSTLYATANSDTTTGAVGGGEPQPKKGPADASTVVLPQILMSGRDIAGEADYKMLHIHRALVSAHLSANVPQPSFLFVSEDSDVLCGALCGPLPQSITLGTTLRDTTMEMCLLRMEYVLAYIGQCADVLLYKEQQASSGAAAMPPPPAPPELTTARYLAPPTADAQLHPLQEAPSSLSTDLVAADEDDIVRRKKKEGPMIATGTKIKLDDSDDDSDGEAEAPTVTAPSSRAAVASAHRGAQAAVTLPSPSAAATLQCATPTDTEVEIASYLRTVSVDFVFLFTMIMGNTGSVPALARGATKVDMQTCWQLYCQKKYCVVDGEQRVNNLLSVTTGSKKNDLKAYVKLNTAFLHTVLHNLNYSDHLSRPPVAEERDRALKYLTRAVSVTLRYVIGCHVAGAPPLQLGDKIFRCFLDTRLDGADDDTTPTLAALIAVLAAEESHVFVLPMRGEAITTNNAASHHTLQQQTDVDSTLVPVIRHRTQVGGPVSGRVGGRAIGGAACVPLSKFVAAGASAWKTVAANVESATKSLPTAFGLFERMDAAWNMLTAQRIVVVQDLARQVSRQLQAMKTTKQPKMSAKNAAAAKRQAAEDHQTSAYSFELRRMAPVMVHGADGARKEPAADHKSTGEASAAKAALMQAAGLSYAYTSAPASSATSAMASGKENDHGTAPTPSQNRKRTASGEPVIQAQKQPVGDEKAKPRRLGKKERMKLKAKQASVVPEATEGASA